MDNKELEMMGYQEVFNYTQYSHDNHVNVIPEESFKQLIADTFKTITDVLRRTYGPYGSTIMISEQNQTTSTKDGYNVFSALSFSHVYKRMVYLAISKIINRVNANVGDGTTSCILLAEQIFNELNQCFTTPIEKRELFHCLNMLETILEKPIDPDVESTKHMVRPLHVTELKNLLSVANNYDFDLSDTLYQAMAPETDAHDYVTSIRNVVVDANANPMSSDNTSFDISFMPGNYRVAINMDLEHGKRFNTKTQIKVALYNHTFGSGDWAGFLKDYDRTTPVIIMAPAFTKGFMDNEFLRYSKNLLLAKVDQTVFLCQIKSNDMQNEIRDLGAILNTEVFDLSSSLDVDHTALPVATLEVYKGNAMCFYTDAVPTTYIERVKEERDKDLNRSMTSMKKYNDRIKALSLTNKDTLLTITASSTLECKMLVDKIDDCVCVAESAFEHGTVPNLLQYAYKRIAECADPQMGEMFGVVCGCIHTAIQNLAVNLFMSKIGDKSCCAELGDKLFHQPPTRVSYNLVTDEYVDASMLPTSAQYDLEVVTAAISIVKYLLTSRALVFDANLIQPMGDDSFYQKMN